MKTRTNIWEVLVIAVFFSSYTLSGNMLSAQSDPDNPGETELSIAFSELEAFMIESEKSIVYNAPFNEASDVEIAAERLERLAENFSKNLKYHAPDFDVLSEQDHKNKPVLRELITQKKVAEAGFLINKSL